MAKSKKAVSKKEEPAEDIPEEMASDLQDAISAEDEPSAALRATKIPITHWEEDPVVDDDKDGLEVAVAATRAEQPLAEVELSEEESSDAEIEADTPNDDEELTEVDETDEPADGHEWHLIEDEENPEDAKETSDTETQAMEVEEEDESERPDWDEETWKQKAELEDETADEERPEWDEETWRQANIDEEEAEGPEWDAEKWQTPQQVAVEEVVDDEVDRGDEAIEAAASTVTVGDALDQETEGKSTETESNASIQDEDYEEDVDIDSLSAAQLALNQDDETPKKTGLKSKLKSFLASLKSSKTRTAMVASFAVLLLLVIAVPTPRYAVLNTVGVRATASLKVIDSETKLPLRDVSVELAGQEATTSAEGEVTFDGVRLGAQQLTVTKSAYDTYVQSVRVGVGENPLSGVELVAVGTSFEFSLVDWLSNEPVSGAEVVFETNAAFADEGGVAKLNTPDLTSDSITVTARAPGYLDQEVDVNTLATDPTAVRLVLDRYHTFVSQRDGTYDVYKIRPDGSGEELLIKGTGNERSDIRFGASPSGEKAILVATRDTGIKNSDGFVLSGIYLIDVETGKLEKIDSSERIDLVGWIGERVIYVKVQAGASGRNLERHRLVSYDTQTKTLNQIAASNYFNDVLVAKDYIFYAPSDAFKQNPKPYLYRSNSTGSKIDTVFEKNVWTVIRTGYNEIQFDSDQTWYVGEIDKVFNVEADAAPTDFVSILYAKNPSKSSAAWVDRRDGKGVLITTDTKTEIDTILKSEGGLRNPLHWASDSHLVYRIVSDDETADYILNTKGGEAKKIRDVTDVSGSDRWYYYY